MFSSLSVGLRKGTRMQRMNYLIFLIVFLCCKTYASNAILHKEKCHFCLNYSLTFAFRSYSGPNCATNKKMEFSLLLNEKKTSMLINWLAFYIDCVWQCAKSDKRERKKAIDSNSNETMYRTTRSMVLAIVCLSIEPGKKHSHFHLCIPRRQTIRDKHVTVTVTVFFSLLTTTEKNLAKKRTLRIFFVFWF